MHDTSGVSILESNHLKEQENVLMSMNDDITDVVVDNAVILFVDITLKDFEDVRHNELDFAVLQIELDQLIILDLGLHKVKRNLV